MIYLRILQKKIYKIAFALSNEGMRGVSFAEILHKGCIDEILSFATAT